MNKDWEKAFEEVFDAEIFTTEEGLEILIDPSVDKVKSFIRNRFVPKSQLLEMIEKEKRPVFKGMFMKSLERDNNFNAALDQIKEKITKHV